MPDPEWFRQKAAAALRRAEKAAAEGDVEAARRATREAGVYEVLVAELTGELPVAHPKRLSDETESVKVGSMETVATEKKRRGPPSTAKGPVGAALKHTGMSLVELAEKLGKPYNTVRIWGHRGKVADTDALAKLQAPPFAPSRGRAKRQ